MQDSLTHALDEGCIYPVKPTNLYGDDDTRFTVGLLFDVRDLLVEAGYPIFHSGDLIDLQQALYRFLYVGADRPDPADVQADDELIESMRAGAAAPQCDQTAQMLAAWRDDVRRCHAAAVTR